MDGEKAKFIINVEPQKTTQNIHYKLMKRAVYYAARLISSQKEKEFHGDDFNNLKKNFSIWICMDVQNYDLLTIIILNLGKNSTTHKLLNLLHLIFMKLKSSEEKEKILRDEYNI